LDEAAFLVHGDEELDCGGRGRRAEGLHGRSLSTDRGRHGGGISREPDRAEMRGFDTLTIALRDGKSQEQKFPPRDLERAELEAFAAAIADTRTFPVSAEEAVHGIGVLEAIGRSAETGRTVTIA